MRDPVVYEEADDSFYLDVGTTKDDRLHYRMSLIRPVLRVAAFELA